MTSLRQPKLASPRVWRSLAQRQEGVFSPVATVDRIHIDLCACAVFEHPVVERLNEIHASTCLILDHVKRIYVVTTGLHYTFYSSFHGRHSSAPLCDIRTVLSIYRSIDTLYVWLFSLTRAIEWNEIRCECFYQRTRPYIYIYIYVCVCVYPSMRYGFMCVCVCISFRRSWNVSGTVLSSRRLGHRRT